MYRYFSLILIIAFGLRPEFTIAAEGWLGFVNCEGAGCSACDLVSMTNEIIGWLIGMVFLIFAALMTVAGFGLVTSGGNPSALSAAKDKFKNALIGIVIVMSAWLIVNTIMVGLVSDGTVGGEGKITGWGPWSEVQCQTQTSTTAATITTTSVPPVVVIPPPGSGDIQTRIAQQAQSAFQTMSTASHSPGGGTLACAWAVNQILARAGVNPVNGDSVVSMKSVLDGGRGTKVNQADAKAGDLVLVTGSKTLTGGTNANHVGICMNNGCSQVYSNSSSRRSFSWPSGPTFSPSYVNATPIFYRINN